PCTPEAYESLAFFGQVPSPLDQLPEPNLAPGIAGQLKVLGIWPSQPFVQGGVAFTPDDRFLTAWNNKVGLLLLDIASHGKEKFEIPCSSQFAVTQDGRMLAACNGKDIMLWDLSGPAPVQRTVIQQHTDTVTRVLFAPDGQTLYS